MRKTFLTISLILSTFLVSSCSQEPSATKETTTSPPTAKTTQPPAAQNPTQPPASKTPPPQPQNIPQITGLTPATDAKTRLAKINDGRPDPFAPVFGKQDKVTSTPPPDTQPPKKEKEKEKSQKPPAPQPDLAREVVVSGIIKLGDITNVILKAPNEQSFRYVQPGQYIANGQVLVKRVDWQQGSTVVILEQLGMEVRKSLSNNTRA